MEAVQRAITAVMTQDVTECRCQQPGCGFCERTGPELAVVHSAEHAMVTGHPVQEIHTRVMLIRERA